MIVHRPLHMIGGCEWDHKKPLFPVADPMTFAGITLDADEGSLLLSEVLINLDLNK